MVGRGDDSVRAAAVPRRDRVELDARLDRERAVHLRDRQQRMLGAEGAADELCAAADRPHGRAERGCFDQLVVGHAVRVSQ